MIQQLHAAFSHRACLVSAANAATFQGSVLAFRTRLVRVKAPGIGAGFDLIRVAH